MRAVVERVAVREAQRRDVLAVIAAQARDRALEVAGWGPERLWPEGRLREAWVVARHGPDGAAQHGAVAAGRLRPEDRARLERAVRRYARYAEQRPEELPAAPLAALLALAGVGGDWTLGRTIRRLDRLSRRMRARATAADPARQAAAARRAQRRHQDARPGGWRSGCRGRAGRAGCTSRPPASRSSTAAGS